MTTYVVNVSESALMHLCLIGLESYCIPRTPKETYGLLWGASVNKCNDATHYIVGHVSTDVEAERTADWVAYSKKSLVLKRNIIEECWPSLSFLGDFHTHPFRSREEARGGYKLSEGDREDVEEENRRFWFRADLKVSLVMAIYPLETRGWQVPGRINNRANTIKWTLRNHRQEEYYRLRLSAYVIQKVIVRRRKSLILTPRETNWDDNWMGKYGVTAPDHSVYLDIPSILGNPNFTGERR